MKIITRRLKPEDMDQWFEVRIQSLKDSPAAFLASPEDELEQGVEFFRERMATEYKTSAIFGSFDEKKLVGTVGVIKEWHKKANHKAFIWGMYVKPDCRGKKLGKELVQQAIDFAKNDLNVEQVTLSVMTSQAKAKKLYEKMGFEVWGLETKAVKIDGKYYDEEFMKLDLTNQKK